MVYSLNKIIEKVRVIFIPEDGLKLKVSGGEGAAAGQAGGVLVY